MYIVTMIMSPGLHPPRAGAADSELRVGHDPCDPRPGRHLHPLKLRRSVDQSLIRPSLLLTTCPPSLPGPDNSIPNAFLVMRITTSILSLWKLYFKVSYYISQLF